MRTFWFLHLAKILCVITDSAQASRQISGYGAQCVDGAGKCNREHINNLEMRAVLCALKWRLAKQGAHKQRLMHLTDSLVCLHTLTRGRTSSRKLRRTVARINALLLLSQNVAVWAYVHTALNPADAPLRGHFR